jgi:hypothetical protein
MIRDSCIGSDESSAVDYFGFFGNLYEPSVWYKLIDKTYIGAYISIVVVITSA